MVSVFTLKRRSRPFALREYDLNRLDGNISTFSDRFLTNFQVRASGGATGGDWGDSSPPPILKSRQKLPMKNG